jgi:hypothetical protein
MSISCIKIITGEDLIGEIVANENTVEIDTPLQIVVVPTQNNNQFTVGLAPYMPYAASKKLVFNNEHVLLHYAPAPELNNDYNRITGKGIVIPKSTLSLVE